MYSSRRTASTLMAGIVLATLAACGTTAEAGSGPIYDNGPRGSEISEEVEASLGPKVTVRFDITGAVTLKGTSASVAPSGGLHSLKSCAEYAQGTAEKQYVAPGLMDDAVDDPGISFEMRIAGYHGPGTYSKDRLIGIETGPMIAIDTSIYTLWPDDSTSRVTTDGKGGGKWTFTKVANRREGSSPDDAISGTVSWTCRER